MELLDILKPSAVKVTSSATSKKRLFMDLGAIGTAFVPVSKDIISDALLERENLGPTGVGNGVALPHARIAGIDSVVGMFVRLETPLDFDAADRQPVDLVFALLAPEDAGVEHLKALALVSRTLRDKSVCMKLRANTDPATLHAILTESQSTQAA